MRYQEKIKEHLAHYKNTELKITENGKWRGKEYGHILPRERKEENIFESYRKDFFDDTLSEINYHINFHHLNSSQAMCINFFYPLYKRKRLDLVLAVLEIKKEQIAYKKVCFEKISDIDGTSFDFYFETKSGLNFYFEIKYTENGFGRAKNDDEHKCKYKEVYKSKLQNIKDEYKGMRPFFANYQIIRNLIHIDKDSYVVFVYPQENIKIREGAEKTAEILEESAKSYFHCLPWEKLLTHIDKAYKELPEKLRNNVRDFKRKYMLK